MDASSGSQAYTHDGTDAEAGLRKVSVTAQA